MPRPSIFDPEGPNRENRGSRFTGPDADQVSHMSPSVTDGKVSEEEAADLERLANFKPGDSQLPGADTLDQIADAEIQHEREARDKTHP